MLNIAVGFGAERFVASLLALTSFGSYNKRVCGSLPLTQMPPPNLYFAEILPIVDDRRWHFTYPQTVIGNAPDEEVTAQ